MKTHINAIKNAIPILSLVAAIFTLAMMIYAGRGWEEGVGWWLTTFGFALFALSPYAGLAWMGRKLDRTLPQCAVVFVGTLLVCLFGVGLLIDGLFFNESSTSGLLFIVLPIYQWPAVVAIGGIAYLMGRSKGAA
ncbi:MAG: hypothetical protein H6751_04865 [Candidatus Omnitrophica bacterium]|nr:hypothetical protein [Candidatus Omnitrophota bacterium]MCB9782276.1 hypothetical protein [Candidatus Omnitrophota bacterium]